MWLEENKTLLSAGAQSLSAQCLLALAGVHLALAGTHLALAGTHLALAETHRALLNCSLVSHSSDHLIHLWNPGRNWSCGKVAVCLGSSAE